MDKLKKEYHYMPDKAGIDELLAKGSTSRVLFTLDGKAYGGKSLPDLPLFIRQGRADSWRLYSKTILDYENSRLELKHPEFCALVQGHRDSMLLAEITDREVGKRSVVDEAGLKAYLRRTVRTSIGTNRVIRVLCCIVLPSGWRSKYGNF